MANKASSRTCHLTVSYPLMPLSPLLVEIVFLLTLSNYKKGTVFSPEYTKIYALSCEQCLIGQNASPQSHPCDYVCPVANVVFWEYVISIESIY